MPLLVTRCPHCSTTLSDEELRALWGRYRSGQRRNQAGPPRMLSAVQRKAICILAESYNQSDIAEAYGVSQSLVSRIISGDRR